MAPLGEVQMVQGFAAQFSSGKYGPIRGAAGIIGTADLAECGAEVEPLLIACKSSSPNFRGIRCVAANDANMQQNFCPNPGLYMQQKFREGFALLEKHDLVFDAWVYSSQLSDVHDLAKSFPSTTIVLNHIGTPVAALGNLDEVLAYEGKQEEILSKWKTDMILIANECPNVYIKIGGAGVPVLGHGFSSRNKPPTSEEVASVFRENYLW
eukprot:CAMPEP_0113938640 /NCGR_PEP_ID=MMETSP1339-20121228/5065_1 /TAXON_ID=94617 /ORGANISM="Fibrocapsa japonica" /LENGTH=209 /DNA_ID=CAMNT_0000941855 /DNA_START=41 /DNA_END=667 /DNA_ORIENTATION=+ /assembly_acc=CAM_ASM_000762